MHTLLYFFSSRATFYNQVALYFWSVMDYMANACQIKEHMACHEKAHIANILKKFCIFSETVT